MRTSASAGLNTTPHARSPLRRPWARGACERRPTSRSGLPRATGRRSASPSQMHVMATLASTLPALSLLLSWSCLGPGVHSGPKGAFWEQEAYMFKVGRAPLTYGAATARVGVGRVLLQVGGWANKHSRRSSAGRRGTSLERCPCAPSRPRSVCPHRIPVSPGALHKL